MHTHGFLLSAAAQNRNSTAIFHIENMLLRIEKCVPSCLIYGIESSTTGWSAGSFSFTEGLVPFAIVGLEGPSEGLEVLVSFSFQT